jgi:hypothetical protein
VRCQTFFWVCRLRDYSALRASPCGPPFGRSSRPDGRLSTRRCAPRPSGRPAGDRRRRCAPSSSNPLVFLSGVRIDAVKRLVRGCVIQIIFWGLPAEGFEPPTYGLQNRCTTTVLSRRRACHIITNERYPGESPISSTRSAARSQLKSAFEPPVSHPTDPPPLGTAWPAAENVRWRA